jgi:7,8-dihydropterin-6-yl-methyl-4-(beta-D-ribofuranosyl)aminobenzene 5'-phosphate synthase
MKVQIIILLTAMIPLLVEALNGEPAAQLKLTVVFNNEPLVEELKTSWGFACVIEGLERTVLFDTGGDGDILIENMRKLGVGPEQIDLVFISHFHRDHTGGLEGFLRENPTVTVAVPRSFPAEFISGAREYGAEVMTVSGSEELFPGVYSTGEMDGSIIEQSLVIATTEGAVVVTGCSHPGVDDIVNLAGQICNGKVIRLVIGGFHLGRESQSRIQGIISAFRDAEVQRVAPTHCTGDQAMQRFREAWGENYVQAGCGAEIILTLH